MPIPNFNHWRTIVARYNSTSTGCGRVLGGHPIKRGELIGYAGRRLTMCSDCWASWRAENEEAERLERQHGY